MNKLSNEEIIDKVTNLALGKVPNSKFQMLRMYGAFEREHEKHEIIDKFRERVSNNILDDIILISDTEAICIVRRRYLADSICYQPVILSNYQNILCDTLDEALILLVCMRKNCVDAAKYMMKLME